MGHPPSSSRAPRARDALAIVEAGYSLEGTDADWLARVLDAARPDLDQGLGSYAFTCRVNRGKIEIGPAYVERELSPEFSALVAHLNRTVPDDFFDLIARSAVLSGGFAAVVPQALLAHVRGAGASLGVVDAFALFAQDGEGYGINLSGPSRREVHAPSRVRGTWNRVGVHLASAMRLRRRLSLARAVPDALLEPSGSIAHAEREVRDDLSARDALTLAVRDIERARTTRERRDPERALELWRGLVAGEWSLVDQWERDGRRYVAAYRNRPDVRDPRTLTPHERTILHYAGLGGSNKEIAFTLGLSTGAVASGVSQLLRKLRCARRSDLLAFSDPASAALIRVSLGDESDEEVDVLSLSHAPSSRLTDKLSPAEREIAALVVAGKTNAAIARARRTSHHTVANQMRSIFDKTGASNRTSLVRMLTQPE